MSTERIKDSHVATSSSCLRKVPHVAIGFAIRIILAFLLPLLLDEQQILPGVSYTDIDYYVFTDAADYILKGGNGELGPYARTTYRYTPFLAGILSRLPHHRFTARYLFCIADGVCGWIIYQYRQKRKDQHHSGFIDACYWLYNPVPIIICTRGSAESFQVLLPVLLTLWCAVSERRRRSTLWAAIAGIVHGVAVHSKIYPIIYTASYLTHFKDLQQHSRPSLLRWVLGFFQIRVIMFGATFILSAVGLTYYAVACYGDIALQEGFLYHISRLDHRHNFSMHWYWIYLVLARSQPHVKTLDIIFSGLATPGVEMAASTLMSVIGRLLLIPQLVLLTYTSFVLTPSHGLELTVFVQSFLFVAYNKVITAQYFTWYLCILPLCSYSFQMTSYRVKATIVCNVISIGFWLGSAYMLEMQGLAVHRLNWLAGALFFVSNVSVLDALLRSTVSSRSTSSSKVKSL